MKRAALGIQMHSGWGVLVAVAGDANSVEVLERRRITVTNPSTPGATQPYHHAATLKLADAEKHLAHCAAASGRMALEAVEGVVQELGRREYRVAGSAVLLASGRPLPSLERILAAHPLIHTAEGEFFRNAVKNACERLQILVIAFPERELEDRAKKVFGKAASQIQGAVSDLGRSIGPPWTKDHKTAALAAAIILAKETGTE
jgi:hypothetical protein